MSTIVIDPGHGGNKKIRGSNPNNAVGPSGTLEKAIVLLIALETAKFFGKNYPNHTTILTRSTDVNLGLPDRAQIAKDNKANVFVSIHLNGDDNPKIQGTEIFVHPDSSNSSSHLAKAVLSQVVGTTKYRNRGLKKNDFGVLRPKYHSSQTASCLLEISFLTDPNEEKRLSDPIYIAALGESICKGVIDYLK